MLTNDIVSFEPDADHTFLDGGGQPVDCCSREDGLISILHKSHVDVFSTKDMQY